MAALRAVSWSAIGILLVDPSFHRSAANGTVVLLDGSLSMSDAGSDARWQVAVDSARALARGGRILLFGGEPRLFTGAERADLTTSLLFPSLREAAARGGRIAIVTDGLVDDADALPGDLLRVAHVVVLPRPERPDAGIALLDLPAALRAGDTATASVTVAMSGATARDTALLEVLEAGRVVARARVTLGSGGIARRELSFVPGQVRGAGEVRRYEARLSGFAKDGEPRDDRRETAALVTRASAIVLVSDSPDWDFRWLARALMGESGVPVHAFVRLGEGGWRESRSLKPVSDEAVRSEVANAALVVAHGTAAGAQSMVRLARRASVEWVTQDESAGPSGEWYVAAPELASPVGGAFAGVPAESLPPIEGVRDSRLDSVVWTGPVAQLDRRGRSRPVIVGTTRGGRHGVVVLGAGLWRWASHGGLAEQAYRSLTAAMTDWLLEERSQASADLTALRDSLARGAGEFLPRRPTLAAQPGMAAAAAGESVPVLFSAWLYLAALAALVTEWVGRRRRGLR